MIKANKVLPVEIIFNPKWWHENAHINFDKDFFYNPKRRVDDEQKMRRYLYERFQIEGLGEKNSPKIPIVGPVHLAAGYIIPELFGCNVKYQIDGPPEVQAANMSLEKMGKLEEIDLLSMSPTKELFAMIDELEKEYGYVRGDVDFSGILNHALDIRGQEIFLDMYDDAPEVDHLFNILYKTIMDFTNKIYEKTKSTSTAVNPVSRNFSPQAFLHSNCSVQMLSNEMYEDKLLKYDIAFSKEWDNFGIHHCGNNMDVVAKGYAKSSAKIYDVGYGSNIGECRKYLKNEFFNLRLSPVKLLTCSVNEVREDVRRLIMENGSIYNAGVCCINMDYNTPDENIKAIYETVLDIKKEY